MSNGETPAMQAYGFIVLFVGLAAVIAAVINVLGGAVSLAPEWRLAAFAVLVVLLAFAFGAFKPLSGDKADLVYYLLGGLGIVFLFFDAGVERLRISLTGDYAIASNPRGFDLGIHDGDYYGYGITLAGVAHALSGAGANSLDALTFDLALNGSSPDLVNPTALAAVPWALAAYSQGGRTIWTFQRGTEYVAVYGVLESLAAVPEPAVDGLAALGLLAAAALGFRRART